MSAPDLTVEPRFRSALAERNFPAKAAEAAERDWYWFVLDELNGLATLLRFQREHKDASATRTEGRIRTTLATLRWDEPRALRQTWGFVQVRLPADKDPDAAWAPHLVLFALEPVRKRVRDWFASLPRPAQAVIESTLIV
jgi:hypothetical protein